MAQVSNQNVKVAQQEYQSKLNGLKASEYINQNGLNKALTQEQAAKISVFLPGQIASLNYGLQKEEISQEDYDKAIRGEQMSADGQTAFNALRERLATNFTRLLSYFTNNDEVGENEEALSTKEQAAFDRIMADGIVTDEELAEYEEEIAAAEEAEEEEEEPVEEEPVEEEGKPGRAEEVNAAFEAFLGDLESGKEFDIKNHPGINQADYNGIVSDFKDDGIIGNGARKDQFSDDTISSYTGKLANEAKAAGKNLSYTYKDENGKTHKQTLKGIYDDNDSRYTYKDEEADKKDKKKGKEE